jgi:hypothetical protein
MSQGEVEKLCKASQSCHVRKVARLLARPLSARVTLGTPRDAHRTDFLERRQREVRRTPLLSGPVDFIGQGLHAQ